MRSTNAASSATSPASDSTGRGPGGDELVDLGHGVDVAGDELGLPGRLLQVGGSRSGSIGQAPTTVCQASSSSDRVGQRVAGGPAAHRGAHSPGSSASTASRARTSSPRLVSWVDSVVMVAGHDASRAASAAWNSAGETPNRAGSPPTSLSATNRFHR